MPKLKMNFPLRPEFEAWAKRYLAQAKADSGRRLVMADPAGGEAVWESCNLSCRELASNTVRAIETALFVGHLDQRKKADQRRFLAKQVYDIEESKAKYAIFLGTDCFQFTRILVDDLNEVSLSELAWFFEMERLCVMEIRKPSGQTFTRTEQRAVAKHVLGDIYFDVTKDDCKVESSSDSKGVRIEIEWASEDVPVGLLHVYVAMAEKKSGATKAKSARSKRSPG